MSKAEYAVGHYTEKGIGRSPDFEEARKWYLRSAQQGNKRAIKRLDEIKEYFNGSLHSSKVNDKLLKSKNQEIEIKDTKNTKAQTKCSIM